MVPLCPEKFSLLLLFWSRFMHAALTMHAILAAPSSKPPPLYVPVSPVARAARCKPCLVALVSTLGCSRPPARNLDLLRSALSGRIIPESIFILKSKRSLHFSDTSSYPATKEAPAQPRRFRSCLDERAPARRESAGFPLSAPMPTYPRRDPGPKRPRAARP